MVVGVANFLHLLQTSTSAKQTMADVKTSVPTGQAVTSALVGQGTSWPPTAMIVMVSTSNRH